ncbi:MAG TPA: hypothetical protein ENK17_04135 [Anaerolineae bacterium]|nr:hypothetical protein [Anaerolineae bacterium]
METTARVWFEVTFDIAYLVIIWGLVVTMIRRRNTVRPSDRLVARLVTIAFTLLAFGDTGHVGFRVLVYVLREHVPFGTPAGLLGLGKLATAVTVTLFYVLMVAVWRHRFDKQYGPLEYLMFGAALLRLIMLTMPANRWDSPVSPHPWAIIRNMPLLVQGLVAFSFLRDGGRQGDQAFWWMGIMILISFACYMAVVLLVQRIPLIGLLMIPKTIAYLVMAFLAYKALYGASNGTERATA